MFTMTMKGDPKKIMKDGRYTMEEFDALLRHICLETRFKEKSPGEYYLEESEDEIGRMTVLFTKIDKYDTIVPLLSKWMSQSDDDGDENLLHFWLNRRDRKKLFEGSRVWESKMSERLRIRIIKRG